MKNKEGPMAQIERSLPQAKALAGETAGANKIEKILEKRTAIVVGELGTTAVG